MPISKRRPTILSDDYKALVALAKDLRLKASIDQKDMAKRLRMSQATISKLETGEVLFDPLVLRDWCLQCGSTLGELVNKWER